jgi:hypothetical protein
MVALPTLNTGFSSRGDFGACHCLLAAGIVPVAIDSVKPMNACAPDASAQAQPGRGNPHHSPRISGSAPSACDDVCSNSTNRAGWHRQCAGCSPDHATSERSASRTTGQSADQRAGATADQAPAEDAVLPRRLTSGEHERQGNHD